MNKAIFIISYFGKFNNYFQLFLESCKYNLEYNWLIITDDKNIYNCPNNVKIINYDFQELQEEINRKFGFKVTLSSPYKLCDLKPMYGYIFEKYILEYDYWGYCDNDLIFGKISNFIDFNQLHNYDKIGVLGHFTLFKNKKEINELFMKNDRYKKVLTTNKSMKFDEEYGEEYGDSINNIFEQYQKNIYNIDSCADIYVKSSIFKLTHYLGKDKGYYTEKKDKSLFVWEHGRLFKYIFKKHKVERKEYMYIHLQKRKMNCKILNNCDRYKIIPNAFEKIENIDLSKEKKYNINLHYFKIRWKNLKNKVRNRIGE